MATNKPFLTFTMHRFINATKDAVKFHQESFGTPMFFGIIALQFLMNPRGNLKLYASITKLVTSTVENESTTTPESLAAKWFHRDLLVDGLFPDRVGGGNPLVALCASSMWFLRFYMSFEDYDRAKYHALYKSTIPCLFLLCVDNRGSIEKDVSIRMIALHPYCLIIIDSLVRRTGRERFDEFLNAFSGNLEDVKYAFQKWSDITLESRGGAFFAHVRKFRRMIEISLDTRTVYLDSLASGLIRHSLLNQGESASAGYAELIAMCVGVPMGRKLKLLRRAYDNLERLHEFYESRCITDAPPKKRSRPTVSPEAEPRNLAIDFSRVAGKELTDPVDHQSDGIPVPESIVDEVNVPVAGLENRVEQLGEVVTLELGDADEAGVACAAGVYVDGEPVRPCGCHRVRGTLYCWFHRCRADIFRQDAA